MDLRSALTWSPQRERIVVVDSHTGGEPFRVVVDGLPPVLGDTMTQRRRYAIDHLDHYRRATMWEPRGHRDMYGGWIGQPTTESDLSVLFTHNEGFSTMCGHGIIALTTVVFDTGIIEPKDELRIDTPAGLVTARPRFNSGMVSSVSFLNVASFVVGLDLTLEVAGWGRVPFDLAFGGAFYAYVDAEQIGLDLDDTAAVIRAGKDIKRAVAASTVHPTDPELSFLYGVIFTGKAQAAGNHSRNICVFADGEVDRSPTGTGVSGRLAILHAKTGLAVGEPIVVESLVGSEFVGRVHEVVEFEGVPAIIPEVTGSAHLLGRSEFWIDPDDQLGSGFVVDML